MAAPFPEAELGDSSPPPAFGTGLWFPNSWHTLWDHPDYWDWLAANPNDYRDREYPPSDIDANTGLPPRDHQGVEYVPGLQRFSNGSGGQYPPLRWNEPALRHPYGKKRKLAFVWPSDGKRKHSWGRIKDLFSSHGPDIFVSKAGDRPSRNQWRNLCLDATPEDPGFNTHVDLPWARRNRPYDFKERKYQWNGEGRGGNIVWRDATWPRRGADHYEQPLNYRCGHGQWFNMRWSPFGGVALDGYNGVEPRRKGLFR